MMNTLKIIKNCNFILKRNYSLDTHYDVCIVGGGPVGFGLASLISSDSNLKSKRIVVLESQKHKNYIQMPTFSNRTVALSPQTKIILERCGAWENISNNRFSAVRKMFVWEQTSDSFIAFEKEDSDLAYIVETDLLQHGIVTSLNDRESVQVKYDTTVIDMIIDVNESNETNLMLSDGSRISSCLVIGADGYQSRIRNLANIKSIENRFSDRNKQKAIVCVVKFADEIDNSGVAWQRFTKTGPIGYLPFDKNHCNLIWSTTEEMANNLMALNEEQFVSELNNEIFTNDHINTPFDKLGGIMNSVLSWMPSALIDSNDYWKIKQIPPTVVSIVPKSRATFPLGFMHATNYVSKNVALVGDAAHRILPLAGQGVNLGFGDDECLVKCLSEGFLVGETINNHMRLQQYETERQRYVVPVAATVQALNELYYSDFLPFVFGRAVGLKVVNAIKPLKEFFLHGATKGKLPIICCEK